MERQPTSRPGQGFWTDFRDCWQRLPNKGFFLGLLVAWLALFQFLGNSTLGYFRTRSLLHWMYITDTSTVGNLLDSEGAFSLLIPLVVLVLFWLKRRQLISLPLSLWWPGLLIVAVALGLHFIGYAVQHPRLSFIALFAGIFGLSCLALEPAWLRVSFFPYFLFGLCVPLGSLAEPISFRLRLLSSQLVALVSQYV